MKPSTATPAQIKHLARWLLDHCPFCGQWCKVDDDNFDRTWCEACGWDCDGTNDCGCACCRFYAPWGEWESRRGYGLWLSSLPPYRA